MRRALLLCLATAMAGCADIGGTWPNLSPRQEAERDRWQKDVRWHVEAVLAPHGIRFSARPAETPPGTGMLTDTFTLRLTVDRLGDAQVVSVLERSDEPGLDRKILTWIREGGPLPLPPPSLVAFNNWLNVNMTIHRWRRAPSARVA